MSNSCDLIMCESSAFRKEFTCKFDFKATSDRATERLVEFLRGSDYKVLLELGNIINNK